MNWFYLWIPNKDLFLRSSSVVSALDIELPRSLVEVVIWWNEPMHFWLKTCNVYSHYVWNNLFLICCAIYIILILLLMFTMLLRSVNENVYYVVKNFLLCVCYKIIVTFLYFCKFYCFHKLLKIKVNFDYLSIIIFILNKLKNVPIK